MALVVATAPAHAQPAGGGETDGSRNAEQDLVVTARRWSESIREIPDTIQAFSSASLERAGVESISDMTQMVSGFRVVEAQQPGVVLINIRGIGQVRNGESPIAVVVDGVQQNSPNQITQDLLDVERIEVLKGPQGSLYGRNAIGGAIIITTKPPAEEFGGSAEAGYAQGNEFSARATVSGPLGERMGFRLGGSYLNRDGQIYNSTLDTKVDYNEVWAVRGSLVANPVDAVTVDLRGSHYNQEAGASWYRPGPANAPREPVIGNLLGWAERKLTDISGKVEVDLGGPTLTSITAYSKVKSDLFEELDWEPLDLVAATQLLDVEAWSQEFRLTSDDSGPLRWMAGLYYLDTRRFLDTTVYMQPDLTGLPAPIAASRLATRDRNRAYAAFGQLTYKLTDALELTAGLRYDIDRRKQHDLTPPTPTAPTQFKATYRSLQPKFSLAYSFDDGTLAYATVAKGFRSGGFNSNDVVTREFRKEELWSYELGFKTAFADNRLYLNGALFFIDISDRQVAGLDLTTGPAQFIANPIPRSTVRGAEIELNARPLEGLDLSFGGSFLSTRINEYDQSVFAGTAANGDFTGNRLNQVPRYSINAAAQYTAELGGRSRLISRMDVTGWGGDYYWEINNADLQNPVWLFNARLTWEIGDVSVTAFARNLFNRRYDLEFVPVEFAGTVTGEDVGGAAPPRQLGASFKLLF
ncbi:TonB-dependent receptor [Sandaracinobacter sp. RS1-74]|uniref:TonB-dependent receptor n=1 Tax=Sandaracinobacteroides sayramensis TaxID=2913411 RepID=UPI001EDA7CD9|nr:TonB-dependent receptor [Sandaracinobacteroides sayramensis]MCG2842624.1 TonB-dependent receptor [Sandaracinobacteroides sayramensis]